MALWQFALDLIPASAARVDGVDAIHMTREQLDVIRLDLSEREIGVLFARLSRLLPEKRSWSPDLRIWGDEKTDDVQVWLDGRIVEGVQFRLDVSNLSFSLASGICDVARSLACLLATRAGAIVQPSSEAIVRAVLQSPATRFVRNPEAYLAEAVLRDTEAE